LSKEEEKTLEESGEGLKMESLEAMEVESIEVYKGESMERGEASVESKKRRRRNNWSKGAVPHKRPKSSKPNQVRELD
jgi:hypothetical protein